MTRTAKIVRATAETDIGLSMDLDGTGAADVETGVGFFDHMLCALARHSMIDLTLRVKGDTCVDDHHTVEDTGIVMGQALREALGDKRGIRRFGSVMVPLDEALVMAAVDISGRGELFWDVAIGPDKVGTFDTELGHEFFAGLARDAGITLHLSDMRNLDAQGKPRRETFHSKDGLREFVQYIDSNKESLINDVIHLNTERQGIPVEVALTYNNTYNENIYSFVNNINTIEGGTHLTGFRRGLTLTLKKYAEDNNLLKNAKVEISSDDFREGLTAVISVKVMEPQFEGQTKTKLGNSEVAGAVQSAVSEALRYYLEENPRQAKVIVEKVILAAQARHAAYNARQKVQRKSPLWGGGLPGKLTDCSSRHAEDCELFIVEGDSAGGSAKKGRDRQFQAVLPLRGKILNVEKAMEHKIFDNEEITNLFRALRVTIGTEEDPKAPNLSKLAYHKIIIMTDADVDGAHIATLLMTFFFRRMRPIIENGYLYLATPPLYKCKSGQTEEYCWDDNQVKQFIAAHDGKATVQRFKGLGEMDAEELRDTTMDPENRILKQVNISDAAEADRIFSMLMGEDVGPRRDFIEAHASYANIDA